MKTYKCALISDIHVGFSKNTYKILEKFFATLAKENIDVLFVAGDVSANEFAQFKRAYKLIRRFFPDILVLASRGNHCFWNWHPPKSMSDIFHFETANHSFYHSRAQLPVNKRPPPFGITLARQQEVFKEYNIVHLDGTSYNLGENIVVLGFDGWYNETNLSQLNTNDYKFLPQFIESAPAHIYLKEKAHKDLDKLLNIPTEGKTVITMTHFPPFSESPQYLIWCANPKYMDFITEKSHFFLTGHSHRQCDFVYQGCRVLNAGVNEAILPKEARYDKPRYVIFEVEDKPLSK